MSDNSENLLIIFVKNLIPGHVKTRLAEEIGIDGALDVYQYLVEYTASVTDEIAGSKAIYYSEYVEIEDMWDTEAYKLFIQKGKDLGERMSNAFEDGFDRKFKKIVLIGSDSFEIKPHHIEEAFDSLDEQEAVVGPAKDGGYYLIGLRHLYPQLFANKKYGHKNVLNDLLIELATANIDYHLLEQLADIDTLQDLKDSDIDFQFVDPEDEL